MRFVVPESIHVIGEACNAPGQVAIELAVVGHLESHTISVACKKGLC